MKQVTLLVALMVAASVAASAGPSARHAHADSAPLYPAGGALTTTGVTQVQMTSERVSVEIQPAGAGVAGYRAHVVAEFSLHNPGPATSLTVGYPESVRTPAAEMAGPFQILTVEGLTVAVDGQPVTVSEESVQEDASGGAYDAENLWFAWPMEFESGATRGVTVTFEQQVRGQKPPAPQWFAFDYVLVTGAGWDGLIGDAEISVQFPGDVDLDAFYAVSPLPFGAPAQAGVSRDGQRVVWQNTDFEPNENFSIAFVAPQVGAELRRARQIAASSDDAADHGRLAELLFSLGNGLLGQKYNFNPGNERLLSEGMLAVERGLALDSDSSAVWSALLRLEMGQAYTPRYRVQGEPVGILRAIVAAGRILELDPTDQEARTFLEGVQPYGLSSFADPQVDAIVRQAASLALAGAGPGVPPPTGLGAAADHSPSGSPFRLMIEIGVGLAGGLGLAGVALGASAIVPRSRRGCSR